MITSSDERTRFEQTRLKEAKFVVATKNLVSCSQLRKTRISTPILWYNILHNYLAVVLHPLRLLQTADRRSTRTKREKNSHHESTKFVVVQRYRIVFFRSYFTTRCAAPKYRWYDVRYRISNTTKKWHILGPVLMSRRKYLSNTINIFIFNSIRTPSNVLYQIDSINMTHSNVSIWQHPINNPFFKEIK